MVSNIGDIRAGMGVIGIDGVSLGTVSHTWVRYDRTSYRHDFSQGILPPDIDIDGQGDYFLTTDGDQELYLPFHAIAILFPGETVTVSLTREECREQFRGKPPFLASRQLLEDPIKTRRVKVEKPG